MLFHELLSPQDWIKHDESIPLEKRNQIEPFINSNRSLRLCADICNGLKHFKLTKPRSGENPTFGAKRFFVGLGTGATTIGLKYTIETETGTLDAFALATDCMNAWDEFGRSL